MSHVGRGQSALLAHAHTKVLPHLAGAATQAHTWWFADTADLAEPAELAFPLGPNAPVATIAPTMIVRTAPLGVMLQVPKLAGAAGGKRGARHKPCKNQGTRVVSNVSIISFVELEDSKSNKTGFYYNHGTNNL